MFYCIIFVIKVLKQGTQGRVGWMLMAGCCDMVVQGCSITTRCAVTDMYMYEIQTENGWSWCFTMSVFSALFWQILHCWLIFLTLPDGEGSCLLIYLVLDPLITVMNLKMMKIGESWHFFACFWLKIGLSWNDPGACEFNSVWNRRPRVSICGSWFQFCHSKALMK